MVKLNKLYYSQQYFRHLPFIGFFALILLRNNDLLFLEKIFWILITWGFFIHILTVNNNKFFPIIFWILTHLEFLYPNINSK
jgi:hypothetical protein